MTITVSDGSVSVALTDDLLWSDEFDWQPIEQVVTPTITGAQIVEATELESGRAITLSGASNYGWVAASDLEQLAAWASLPGKQLTLTLRGAARNVVFRHHEKPALSATQVVDYNDREPTDWYVVTIKFMEV